MCIAVVYSCNIMQIVGYVILVVSNCFQIYNLFPAREFFLHFVLHASMLTLAFNHFKLLASNLYVKVNLL